MKIFEIAVYKPVAQGKSFELTAAKDLSQFSFFQRSSIAEFMKFFGETITSRTQPGQRQSIEQDGYIGHVFYRSEGVAGLLITDKEYPIRPAYTLLNKVLDEFIATYPPAQWSSLTTEPPAGKYALPALEQYIKKYQDPSQADAIMRVQQELDDTKVVLHNTIENLLQRGEKLDALVDKSSSLSASSKAFYKQSKKTNSCCVIM